MKGSDVPQLRNSTWMDVMADFNYWTEQEMERMKPKGFHLQSVYISSGQSAFMAKYPTFEEAYASYIVNRKRDYNI